MVNVLVFVLRVVFFHVIVYILTANMYDAVGLDFALSASFVRVFSWQRGDVKRR